jgi:ribosome-associated toxin RatA of RatAB toxin-antitoxin module
MKSVNEILIRAPRERIFELTSDLDNWVPSLPHYRSIQWLERSDDKLSGIVFMAAKKDNVNVSWTSRHEVFPDRFEMHFTHLKKWTKGMVVVWRYEPQDDGQVKVSITHDLNFRFSPLAPFAERIIGEKFIHPVATLTLATFKKILEAEQQQGT